ncbi:MAG: DUF4352 domain-containing protein [Coriobacteriia bacterium]|nr:DUF4352 domain-containing protein [Coriobacteriia bacterium]
MSRQDVWRAALPVLLAGLAGVVALAGCQPADTGREEPPAGSEEAAPSRDATPSEEATPEERTETGSVGEAVSAGSLTLTVREAEFTGGSEGVTPREGRLLEVEIDVTNDGDADSAVVTDDWLLEAGGRRYAPVRVEEPERRGERAVGAGETEDVKVLFDVPDEVSSGVLVFKPVHATGSARVGVP